MIYDGDCGFCRTWIARWQRMTGPHVEYAPFQEAAEQFPGIGEGQFQKSVQLILPDGRVLSGAHAVFAALACAPGRKWLLWMYEKTPGFAFLSEGAYRVAAEHRPFFSFLTRR